MLKKIKIAQLRKGMYINDLKCGWFDHPFALNHFKLENNSDIRKLITAGIKEIEIDTSKGLDILDPQKPKKPVTKNNAIELVQVITAAQELGKAKLAFSEARKFVATTMKNIKMGQYVELEKVNPVVNKMSDSILRNPNALLGLSRIRLIDKYTFEHSVSFSILIMVFAKSMGLSEIVMKNVGIGGLLHDLGKTLTPNEILNKPGKLTDQEFTIMKHHVVDSLNMMKKKEALSQITIDVVAQHHEKYDGTGYPLGLKGDEISIYGQMSAITDVYDALTTDRCYHHGKEPSEVLKLLLKWSGSHFNPKLVQKFIQSVGIYPVGSLVLLNNHFLAKVVEIHENMLKPEVEVFLNTRNRSYVPHKIVNLANHPDLRIISVESYAKWNLNAS